MGNVVHVYFTRRMPDIGRDERILRAAGEYLGVEGERLSVIREERGKPRLTGADDVFISVSHSADIWLCAFYDGEVGVDIQIHNAADYLAIARRFFCEDEIEYVAARGAEAFFDVWAAKESYMKYTGLGLSQGLNSFSVAGPLGLYGAVGGAMLVHSRAFEGYSFCACARDIGDLAFHELSL